eukprot:4783830-Prymnesium_polylepis.1
MPLRSASSFATCARAPPMKNTPVTPQLISWQNHNHPSLALVDISTAPFCAIRSPKGRRAQSSRT